MGQSPATGIVSLRTFPRNFPGRSGTKNDKIYLCSPEVAIASAIKGEITDPRKIDEFPNIREPHKYIVNSEMIIPPLKNTSGIKIIRGPNIKPFPVLGSLLSELDGKVLLKLGDNITTDHILPAGSEILPLRSNVPAISEFTFSNIDATFSKKAKAVRIGFIVGGENYGQGSSREHAALVCRYLGIRAKIAKSFARIHRSNLINFGVIPLVLKDSKNYDKIDSGDHIRIKEIRDQISNQDQNIEIEVNNGKIACLNEFSNRERKLLLSGGLINFIKTSPT
jgi:aconitate hydratase